MRSIQNETIHFDAVRRIALTLPGVEEGTSYGTPAFRVKGKLFLRLHDDGETLVARVDPDERAMLLAASPTSLYLTDHYVNYPWVLVRLPVVTLDDLRERIHDAWRQCAPAKLVADYDARQTEAETGSR